MDLSLDVKQTQQISQNQIQKLNILAMTNSELQEYLQNEYLENPLLEQKDAGQSTLDSVYSDYAVEYRNPSKDNEDDEAPVRDIASPERNILEQLLLSQLDLNAYTEEELTIIRYLIKCLDDKGYFTISPEEVAEKERVSATLVKRCLDALKELEPYGIFSGDLSESLIRQLKAKGLYTELLDHIISDHLEDIANGRIGTISRAFHISTAEVRKSISLIASLHPYPLQGFNDERAHYIVPDVIAVSKDAFSKIENIEADDKYDMDIAEAGRNGDLDNSQSFWDIHLNDEDTENYQLNDYYIHMISTTEDQELKSYFQKKLLKARFLLAAVEQRKQTILRITSVVMKKQSDYFTGQGPLQSLTMQEVADSVHMNVSTVSRAIKNKYLQYPGGTIMLRDCFTSFSTSDNHSETSPEAIKQKIASLIKNENKKKPLSDQTISQILCDRDINISRRTVAKYRDELDIPSSVMRQDC